MFDRCQVDSGISRSFGDRVAWGSTGSFWIYKCLASPIVVMLPIRMLGTLYDFVKEVISFVPCHCSLLLAADKDYHGRVESRERRRKSARSALAPSRSGITEVIATERAVKETPSVHQATSG